MIAVTYPRNSIDQERVEVGDGLPKHEEVYTMTAGGRLKITLDRLPGSMQSWFQH